MAHRFDNFKSAYDELCDWWELAYDRWELLYSNYASAVGYWSDNDDHMAVYHLIQCTLQTYQLFKRFPQFLYDKPDQSNLVESIYWANKDVEAPKEYELTWRKICEALVKDDFEGRYWTIAVIDHMRKLIWDKPFKIVWASKPDKE